MQNKTKQIVYGRNGIEILLGDHNTATMCREIALLHVRKSNKPW